LESSVVVVLFVFEVADVAEPGIWTATCTVPVVVIREAGTGAVNTTGLTSVVVSCVCICPGPTFHKIIAPVTNPPPLTVIVKPDPPAVAVLGLKNATEEEDVWSVRLVLY
jgi:hypothetical protein